MADLHIDDFYKDVAAILLRLYSLFPRKQILFVDDICKGEEPDEFGLPSARHLSCFSAMVWLGEEHFLRYEAPIRQEALDQTILTEKGLLLLSSRSEIPSMLDESDSDNLPPSVMAASQTNVAQLRRALESGSSILIAQCVQHLLSIARDRY
ncbi:MAG TPA: hypothetical protein VFM32_03680 [Spongiibacteraceae bacterium]|nr:hypothetical protein [Spongiibacteraceae bacterium]